MIGINAIPARIHRGDELPFALRLRCFIRFTTPQALHSTAQGRAAHPGFQTQTIRRTPKGFNKRGRAHLSERC